MHWGSTHDAKARSNNTHAHDNGRTVVDSTMS